MIAVLLRVDQASSCPVPEGICKATQGQASGWVGKNKMYCLVRCTFHFSFVWIVSLKIPWTSDLGSAGPLMEFDASIR